QHSRPVNGLTVDKRIERCACWLPAFLFDKDQPASDVVFFFTDAATTEIYTLSLHDALPISRLHERSDARRVSRPRTENSKSADRDRKSTRLNSSHVAISYAVFCLKKKIIK